MKKTLVFFLFLSFNFFIAAQTPDSAPLKNIVDENKTTDAEIPLADQPKKEKSEYDKKLETLKYGLTSDVIALVGDLQTENDTRFNAELAHLFAVDKNVKLKTAILGFFIAQKDEALKNEVAEMLENFYDYKTELLKAGMQYAAQLKLHDASIIEALHTIIDENKTDVKEVAILTLGQIGSSEDAVYLTEAFENQNADDVNMNLIFRQTIMQALIDLHAADTFEFLKDVAEDEYENAIIRARAVTALGKIGNADAIEILVQAYSDEDPNIREAAVAGLAGFSGNAAATDILLQAFKDEYYKVRLKAIEVARETKNAAAFPFILYRAKNDPEYKVKNAAIEALAESGDAEGMAWLKEVFSEEKSGTNLRVKVASTLLKNNEAVIIADVEQEVITAMADKKKKKFAYELGKNISKIQSPQLVKICEVFLNDQDSMYKSIGLDMFETNRFTELTPLIELIAEDKKNGTLKKRAEQLLEKTNTSDKNSPTDDKTTPAPKN